MSITRPAGSSLPDPRADVPTLRAFVAVARCGAVARAAAFLGRTQPSVSARLASLEAAWGTRLFRRLARGMVLTPEGARLLPMAETILRELEELDGAAGDRLGLPPTSRGRIRSRARRLPSGRRGWQPLPGSALRRRLAGVAPVTYHRAIRSGTPLSAAVHRLLELLAIP